MKVQLFESIGQLLDASIQEFSLWFATQPDESRLLAALLIGAVVGAIVHLFAFRISRGILGVLRMVFGPASQVPSAVEVQAEPPTPVAPPDHWHKNVRYGVAATDAGYRMFSILETLSAEKSVGKWLQFDVSWVDAVKVVIQSGNTFVCQDPPPVLSRNVADGEVLPPPDFVYVLRFNGRYHIVAAESEELKSNLTNGSARLIGNKMLRSMADELVAALGE